MDPSHTFTDYLPSDDRKVSADLEALKKAKIDILAILKKYDIGGAVHLMTRTVGYHYFQPPSWVFFENDKASGESQLTMTVEKAMALMDADPIAFIDGILRTRSFLDASERMAKSAHEMTLKRNQKIAGQVWDILESAEKKEMSLKVNGMVMARQGNPRTRH